MKYLLTLAILLLSLSGAYAQSFLEDNNQEDSDAPFVNQYDPKFKGNQAQSPPKQNTAAPSLGGNFTLFLNRHISDSEGMVNLVMRDNAYLGPCVDRKLPNIKIETRPKAMDIEIDGPLLILETASESCNHPEYPSITIPINTKDIKQQNIKEISIKNPQGKRTFTVLADDEKFTLTNKKDNTESITHIFYQDNTVILSAPSAHNSPELVDKILDIAARYDLQQTVYTGKAGEFYFIDTKAALPLTSGQSENIKLDTIKIDDIFHGVNGPYTVKQKIDVFVRKPGLYD